MPDTSKLTQHRQVWQFTWPIMLSNLATPLLGLVDTAIMGHLDDSRYLAAVAIGATIFSMLLWSVAFVKASTTGLTAQNFGQKKFSEVKTIVIQALFLSTCISILMLLAQSLLWHFFAFVFTPPKEVFIELQQYYSIRIWGIPAALFTYVIIGWYIGLQNTRLPMLIAITTNILNAFLNWLFVYPFQMGVTGVALGTLCSEYFGLALGIFVLIKTLRHLPNQTHWHTVFNMKSYQKLIHANVDYFIRTLFLMSTFAFFTRQGSTMGKDYLAVNELLKNFLILMALALDGFAHAAEALAGAAWGSRNRAYFFEILKTIAIWSIATAFLLTLLFGLGGKLLVHMLTDLPNIMTLADQYIIWIIPLPLIAVWCFLMDGIFIGITDTKVMRNNMIFSSLFVFLPLCFLTQPLGNHGLWLALWGFFIARGIGLSWRFYQRYVLVQW